jgi:thioredoxin reductase/nicotinamidase-related amidase
MKRQNYIQSDFSGQAAEWLRLATDGVRPRSQIQVELKRCALVVVDMNRYFAHPEGECYLPATETMIPGLVRLLNAWRARDGMVVFARHGHRGSDDLGMFGKFFSGYIKAGSRDAQLIDDLCVRSQERVVDKRTYDAFFETPLLTELQSTGISQVMVCGVLTHMCVESTVRSAFCRGLEVFVPVDGTAADTEENHLSSLGIMARTTAVLNTVDGFLQMLPVAPVPGQCSEETAGARSLKAIRQRSPDSAVAVSSAEKNGPVQDVVIIGAGPAGVAAAVQCKRLGLGVMLMDRTGKPGGLTVNAFEIENYPGLAHPVTGPDFAARLARQLTRFKVRVHRDTVQQIRPDICDSRTGSVSPGADSSWRVVTGSGVLQARCVVVACGTTPRPLSFIGRETVEQAECLFYEVAPLLQKWKGGRVLIVGGGEASFDYSLSIARSNGTATILCRNSIPRVRGRLAELAKREPRIRLLTSSELIRVQSDRDGLKGEIGPHIGDSGCCVRVAVHRFDVMLVAIGRQSLLPTVLPDSLLRGDNLTPAPGLFICGDARLGSLGQAGIATGDGLFAAQQMVRLLGRTAG